MRLITKLLVLAGMFVSVAFFTVMFGQILLTGSFTLVEPNRVVLWLEFLFSLFCTLWGGRVYLLVLYSHLLRFHHFGGGSLRSRVLHLFSLLRSDDKDFSIDGQGEATSHVKF